jgi:putative FmdB family regulatory protein
VPIYSYTCTDCNAVVEKRQSFSDPPLTTCTECGGALRKVIHPVGIVFKGSGFYVTDSRKATSASTNGATDGGDKGETKAKDTAGSKPTDKAGSATSAAPAAGSSGSTSSQAD